MSLGTADAHVRLHRRVVGVVCFTAAPTSLPPPPLLPWVRPPLVVPTRGRHRSAPPRRIQVASRPSPPPPELPRPGFHRSSRCRPWPRQTVSRRPGFGCSSNMADSGGDGQRPSSTPAKDDLRAILTARRAASSSSPVLGRSLPSPLRFRAGAAPRPSRLPPDYGGDPGDVRVARWLPAANPTFPQLEPDFLDTHVTEVTGRGSLDPIRFELEALYLGRWPGLRGR
jgi:hypothetical protein